MGEARPSSDTALRVLSCAVAVVGLGCSLPDWTYRPRGAAPDGGPTDCDGTGALVDLRTSRQHCGRCGHACAEREGCWDGVCDELVQVAPSGAFTCAVTRGGAALCWGSNAQGQLGDGTHSDAPSPRTVIGLPGRATEVVVGADHACALVAGRAFCWGNNSHGALGPGGDRPTPSDSVPGFTDARQLCSGQDHVCALRPDGSVRCWGSAEHGQLGDGTVGMTASRTEPAQVPGLGPVAEIACGYDHTCARTDAGEVWCWGRNDKRQLGVPDGEPIANPTRVPDVCDAVALGRATHHTCAVVREGSVICWGDNGGQQVACVADSCGDAAICAAPSMVADLFGIVAVSAGSSATCALAAGGAAHCWGTDNGPGILGRGSTTSGCTPQPVRDLGDATYVAAGLIHACAIRRNGAVVCWGNDREGQLGTGRPRQRTTPLSVQDLPPTLAVAAGFNHVCALAAGGRRVRCWGENEAGALGDGGTASRATPAPVLEADGLPLGGFDAITAGLSHGCGLREGGVWCWGWNHFASLGLPPRESGDTTWRVPAQSQAALLTPAVDEVAAHVLYVCARKGLGVYCWGGGDPATGYQPTAIGEVSADGLLVVGDWFGCARSGAGVRCWGENGAGQLGDGTTSHRDFAVPVLGLSDAVSLAAGRAHACAVVRGGAVYCWGSNDHGQLGVGTNAQSSRPVLVPGVVASSVAAGWDHTCATRATGGAVCWGANRSGQLGDGTLEDRASPVEVQGLAGAVVALTASAEHTCALVAGDVRCWGSTNHGRLGDGIDLYSSVPVPIAGSP